MICYSSSHHRSPILVFFDFALIALNLQSQAKMRFDEMVISECAMELLLQSFALL